MHQQLWGYKVKWKSVSRGTGGKKVEYHCIRQLEGLLGRVIGPTQGLYLHTGQHNTEKRRHTSMPRAGFETAISTFERPKIVLASDRSVIEISLLLIT
jgi:hypothetical protein